MGCDYTVIEAVRHQFGDDPGRGQDLFTREYALGSWESGEPFVGISHDFAFKCPAVDGSQMAVLQFNAYGVSYHGNIIQVNGVDLPGGMYQTPMADIDDDSAEPLWHTQSLLVPADILGADENILHIQATGLLGDVDDFIIDNIVIWFKTSERDENGRPVIGGARQ